MNDSRAPDLPAPELDPQQDLVGGVFDVPDSLWKIKTTAEQHPGACLRYNDSKHQGTLLQGTDAENVRLSLAWKYRCLEPDADNGLTTRTAFRLVPRYFRRHRLRLLHAGRVRGRLSRGDLAALREAMLHLYGP